MEKDKWLYDAVYVHELLKQLHLDCMYAYGIVTKLNDKTDYNLSLNFLNLSYQSYIESKRFYYSHEEIYHQEFNDFFESYEKFKLEISEVISKKDSNTSWLFSRYEQLNKSMVELSKLIENALNQNKMHP